MYISGQIVETNMNSMLHIAQTCVHLFVSHPCVSATFRDDHICCKPYTFDDSKHPGV